MNSRLEELTSRWLDREESDEDRAELNQSLRYPANMRTFVEANARDALLRELVQEQSETDSVREMMAAGTIVPMPARPPVVVGAIAAAIAVMLAFAFLTSRDDGVYGRVTAAEGGEHQVGASIALQQFSLAEGFVELSLDSGVKIQLFAPVEAEFENNMKMRLIAGRMSADVGPGGEGFTVLTDAGEVIDLGTRFGIEADRNGEARVAVFSGAVQVRPKNASTGQASVTLTEGQAARFSVLAGLRRWEQVALAAKAAGLASRDYAGIVSRVRDNRGDATLHPFYGIVQGGMQPGALLYTDKPHPRWATDRPMPEWLRGADLIRTYNQFRHKRSFALTLTLREPAEVYVLAEAAQRPPDWLINEFSKIAVQMMAGPFQQGIAKRPGAERDQDGLPWFTFDVWKKTVPSGEVILGPARTEKDSLTTLMYGLAVKTAVNLR